MYYNNSLKALAMYLPQFHRVKENDQWWGEGFTDWISARNAKALYEGHRQPRIPQNRNYYDLLDEKTMIWQSQLMRQYEVDGVCMYHYWFKDGRRILEKPAENLLQWKHIDMPFCFCWANETWARSWSNVPLKNVWADAYESKKDDRGKSILLEQKYGTPSQWKEHFDYLLPFFQDERYIRYDERPVFYFYRIETIPCLKEMVEYWRTMAYEHGLKGLYIIGGKSSGITETNCIDEAVLREPSRTWVSMKHKMERKNGLRVLSYDDVWNEILNVENDGRTSAQAVVGYDDSPRRGKNGINIENASPEKFKRYLAELMAKNLVNHKELTFINAWNEWGEGMYLEPDEKNGEAFLEAIPHAKQNCNQYISKYKAMRGRQAGEDVESCVLAEQNRNAVNDLNILNRWMELRGRNASLDAWLLSAGYNKVALYGYGVFGKHLYCDMCKSAVTVQYIIDRRKEEIQVDIPVFTLEDPLPETDAVIVTAVSEFDSIYDDLRQKGVDNIISLKTILYETE